MSGSTVAIGLGFELPKSDVEIIRELKGENRGLLLRIKQLETENASLREQRNEIPLLPEINRELFLGRGSVIRELQPLKTRDLCIIIHYANNEKRKNFVMNAEISNMFNLTGSWISQLLRRYRKHQFLVYVPDKKRYMFTADEEDRKRFLELYEQRIHEIPAEYRLVENL